MDPRVKEKYILEYKKIEPQIQTGTPRLHRDPITKVMKFRSGVLGSPSKNLWNYIKIKHENGKSTKATR